MHIKWSSTTNWLSGYGRTLVGLSHIAVCVCERAFTNDRRMKEEWKRYGAHVDMRQRHGWMAFGLINVFQHGEVLLYGLRPSMLYIIREENQNKRGATTENVLFNDEERERVKCGWAFEEDRWVGEYFQAVFRVCMLAVFLPLILLCAACVFRLIQTFFN